MNSIKKYYDRHSLVYDFTRKLFLFRRTELINKVNLHNYGNVLEVGVGTGSILSKINSKCKTGIDLSQKMLNIASKKDKSMILINSDFKSYQFDEKFDCVIFSYSLSLMEDSKQILKNTKDALKTSASIYILDFYDIANFYKPYFALHNIKIKENLFKLMQNNFSISGNSIKRHFLGLWKTFLAHGIYNG